MSHFRPVALEHASRLLNHGPTVLITSRSRDGAKRNVMAAAWSMPVEFSPPRIAIVVDKGAHSRQMIEESGAFGICVPAAMFIDATYAVGSVSGLMTTSSPASTSPRRRAPPAGAADRTGLRGVAGVPLITGKRRAGKIRHLLRRGAERGGGRAGVPARALEFHRRQCGSAHYSSSGAGNFVRSGETLRAKPL